MHIIFLLVIVVFTNILHIQAGNYVYPFEKVDLASTVLPSKYSTCRGATVNGIHRVECGALCFDSTSPLWVIQGYAVTLLDDFCYCFLFNPIAEPSDGRIGSCTLCFEDSSMPVQFQLNNAMSTLAYVTPSIFWYPITGQQLDWVSVGPAGVFGTGNGLIYYLQNSRGVVFPPEDLLENQIWQQMDGGLDQITVGTDVIAGVNNIAKVYYRLGISESQPYGNGWPAYSGALSLVVLSEHIDQIWGLNDPQFLYYIPGVTGSNPAGNADWRMQYSNCIGVGISKSGIWVVMNDNTVQYRDHSGTTTTSEEMTPGWNVVESDVSFKQISAEGSEQWVVGVDTSGQLHIRLGITESTPAGTSWKQIDFEFGVVHQASVYKDQLWLTTTDRNVYTRQLLEVWLRK